MKIVAVINARMLSSRLPGKVLLKLKDKTSLFHHIERLKSIRNIDDIWIATTKKEYDDPIIDEAKRLKINYYRGEEEDILERYIAIGKITYADALVRCGCDKPLFSIQDLEKMINNYKGEDYWYIDGDTPVGFKTEIISLKALIETHKHYHGTAIAQYIREHPHKFKIKSIFPDKVFIRPEYRLALDTKEDYQLLTEIYNRFYDEIPIKLKVVFKFLDDNPEIANLNRNFQEVQVNLYGKKLMEKPLMTIYYSNGDYIFKDRANNNISKEEFFKFSDNLKEVLNGKKIK